MADFTGDICCGACCIVLFSGFSSWCNTQPFGAAGCCDRNSTAGCCGSCCNDSFDEDAFDAQVKKDLEKTRDPNAPPIGAGTGTGMASAQQLAPAEEMSIQGPQSQSQSQSQPSS